MYEIRLRSEAEKDIGGAAFWYENQREDLGAQFLDEILDTLKAVAQQPSLFPVVYRGTRRALIHKFPFGIYHQISKKTVIILAVMHSSRNPQNWRQRIKT